TGTRCPCCRARRSASQRLLLLLRLFRLLGFLGFLRLGCLVATLGSFARSLLLAFLDDLWLSGRRLRFHHTLDRRDFHNLLHRGNVGNRLHLVGDELQLGIVAPV